MYTCKHVCTYLYVYIYVYTSDANVDSVCVCYDVPDCKEDSAHVCVHRIVQAVLRRRGNNNATLRIGARKMMRLAGRTPCQLRSWSFLQ